MAGAPDDAPPARRPLRELMDGRLLGAPLRSCGTALPDQRHRVPELPGHHDAVKLALELSTNKEIQKYLQT
jgi:hypothetical protein